MAQRYIEITQRPKVLERDGNACRLCGEDTRRLVVHHINRQPGDMALTNLVALCHSCHKLVHNAVNPRDIRLETWGFSE